jgi:uncharacterized protein (TIGR02246 family)
MWWTRLLPLVVTLVVLPVARAQTQGQRTPRDRTIKGEAKNSEAAIRKLYDRWAKAFRAHDIDGIMSVYATEDRVVGYDIVPPLQYVGKEAYRKDYEVFLAQFDGPIEIEYRDLRIVASGDVAFIHALERMTGTLKNGQKSDLWVRATSGLRKINGKWLIVHDHISVPADLDTGKAVLDLKP